MSCSHAAAPREIGVRAENGCQAACPGGDALDVRHAAGQGFVEECPGQLFGPGSERIHAAHVR
jgi:hypothetical protein